jgi:hypothetical protein
MRSRLLTLVALAIAVLPLSACVQETAPMTQQEAVSADLIPVPAARRILADKLGADWAERPYVDSFLLGCAERRYYRFEDIGNGNITYYSTGELLTGVQFGGLWDCGGHKRWTVAPADVAEIKRALRALGARVN